MGKRSNFERKPRDYYVTPLAAVLPLIPHLPDSFTFAEPCAGNAALALHLDVLTNSGAIPTLLSDIDPQEPSVEEADALDVTIPSNTDFVITNPPWDRKFLHPFIQRIIDSGIPAWLLFDADWAHTKQAAPYLPFCQKIVSVGRVKWFDNTTGKDNCAWYLFGPHKTTTKFVGRE